MPNRLTISILAAMVLGVVAGYATNLSVGMDKEAAKSIAGYFQLLADIFLHLIKMIIAPLVFSTLVAGIAHMGGGNALGRIGGRALGWFLVASFVSLGLGLVFVNLLSPGSGLNLARTAAESPIAPGQLDFHAFVLHIFPTSIVDAMAQNSVLQIVVFSLFFGIGLNQLGEAGKPIVILIETLAQLMMKVTGYVMLFSPFAVFGALGSVVTMDGLQVLSTFGLLVGEFYIALVTLWAILVGVGALFLGRKVFKLIGLVREPVLIAFSTASSEAAYPRLLEQLDRFGIPRRIYSFVLPLGYSFNLDGSMMYATFATIFIAQAYGIDLPLGTQITIMLVLLVTSKGIAAVPRATLVVVAATLAQFQLPVEGVAFVLAIDHFMDMGRTGTNVLGNAIATAVIAKWEGVRGTPHDEPGAASLNAT